MYKFCRKRIFFVGTSSLPCSRLPQPYEHATKRNFSTSHGGNCTTLHNVYFSTGGIFQSVLMSREHRWWRNDTWCRWFNWFSLNQFSCRSGLAHLGTLGALLCIRFWTCYYFVSNNIKTLDNYTVNLIGITCASVYIIESSLSGAGQFESQK